MYRIFKPKNIWFVDVWSSHVRLLFSMRSSIGMSKKILIRNLSIIYGLKTNIYLHAAILYFHKKSTICCSMTHKIATPFSVIAGPPECYKLWWGHAYVLGIICFPPPSMIGIGLNNLPQRGPIPTALHSLILLWWEKTEKFSLNTSIFDTFSKIKPKIVFNSWRADGKKTGEGDASSSKRRSHDLIKKIFCFFQDGKKCAFC